MNDISWYLEHKRDGGELSKAAIMAFVNDVVNRRVTRPQAAMMLTSIFIHGMTEEETVNLTLAMRDSGEVLCWDGLKGPFVDKHSTGGVGDKVSLVLAPLWAELGAKVPMISGRGLAHTGGTLDKLESIPGFRTDLPVQRLRAILEDVGCFICGQTAALAPADRILYALRNETCTVPSIPLITASILSKKLAEGLDELSLDIKWGSGAFMKTKSQAETLAASLVSVGCAAGVKTRALLTEMNEPLGRVVGNGLEVAEAIDCLKGEGPADLSNLVCDLVGDPRAREVLASGAAYARWQRMVIAQGGDPDGPMQDPEVISCDVKSDRSGVVQRCDAYDIGKAAFVLGAGRSKAEDDVNHGVGVMIHKRGGDRVSNGELLATIFHRSKGLETAQSLVRHAFRFCE